MYLVIGDPFLGAMEVLGIFDHVSIVFHFFMNVFGFLINLVLLVDEGGFPSL